MYIVHRTVNDRVYRLFAIGYIQDNIHFTSTELPHYIIVCSTPEIARLKMPEVTQKKEGVDQGTNGPNDPSRVHLAIAGALYICALSVVELVEAVCSVKEKPIHIWRMYTCMLHNGLRCLL